MEGEVAALSEIVERQRTLKVALIHEEKSAAETPPCKPPVIAKRNRNVNEEINLLLKCVFVSRISYSQNRPLDLNAESKFLTACYTTSKANPLMRVPFTARFSLL